MNVLLVSTFIILAIALAVWIPKFRLKCAIEARFPERFVAILEKNVPIYPRIPVELQQQLQLLIKQFLHQKKFYGCGGLEITDEIRVTIAGEACLLLLNRRPRVYPGLQSVLVYPAAFVAPRTEVAAGGVVTHSRQGLLGESWGDGRVILAWDHVQQGARNFADGHNVVLHEFAHQLDSESGSTNGAPLLRNLSSYRSWAAVFSREFATLQADALEHNTSLLDQYGATNPAEFFAVATETFFEMPAQMAEQHPELFEELKKYYRIDPQEWL
ncbi:MAG: M90 family metallopeptidase [Collimonas sp.]|uniref:M90 family metallopeptidase n=1 Tax=Collimonas sp. TaxID=1963772 RepID=UPI003265186E